MRKQDPCHEDQEERGKIKRKGAAHLPAAWLGLHQNQTEMKANEMLQRIMFKGTCCNIESSQTQRKENLRHEDGEEGIHNAAIKKMEKKGRDLRFLFGTI